MARYGFIMNIPIKAKSPVGIMDAKKVFSKLVLKNICIAKKVAK